LWDQQSQDLLSGKIKYFWTVHSKKIPEGQVQKKGKKATFSEKNIALRADATVIAL